MNHRPLIVHVLYRLDIGGMERIIVSIINATQDRYQHAVVCLAGFGGMRDEIHDHAIPCVSLGKHQGKDWPLYARFWHALRTLKPDLVQTYNIGTLDLVPIAKLAGVRRLIHTEHGRDAGDPRGEQRKYQRLRRWIAPCIARYVTVSPELAGWLIERVGIAARKVIYIPNGIDTAAFRATRGNAGTRSTLREFAPPNTFLVCNVARLDKVKDQAGLLHAFALLRERLRGSDFDCRLVIAGDGPERAPLQRLLGQLGLADCVCLLGNRTDIAELLRECNVFVLSSIAEGIPLTVLEAMASGLPVVATAVGGVADVVRDGETGTLVAASDPAALAAAIEHYARDADLRRRHGEAGRLRVAAHFSLSAMVSAYSALYDQLLHGRTLPSRRVRVMRTVRREP
jgi:sugar transferase (PEP-CTERM/EpsH1 system associated)